jgi:uncharacterized protein (TIGR00255 family)
MTAFGRQEQCGKWGQAICEIKTVNHRYLELSIRLPDELRQLETSIRKRISETLNRGKVDCTLRYEPDDSAANEIPVNHDLAAKLVTAAVALQIPSAGPVNPLDILRWPGVIKKETPDPDVLSEPILQLLDATLAMISDARLREGANIEVMLRERCKNALLHVERIRVQLPAMLDTLRARIITRAKELAVNLEHDRLEQEIVLLTHKLDVAEELDRLRSHIEEVTRLLDENLPIGRRLDFLMQEMNREANTLGSKAASIEVTNASIELKVLIEQMREQIQNIE